MNPQEPRTLAGDLQALQEAVRAMLAALRVALVRDWEVLAWSLVIGLTLAGLLGAWFGLIP